MEKFDEKKFSREDMDGKVVHFQILRLGRSLYVWASTSLAMNNFAIAMPTARFGAPATTKLLTGSGVDLAERVSKRLALKCKQPVAVSWNIEGDETMHVWAEKQLVEALNADILTSNTEGLAL